MVLNVLIFNALQPNAFIMAQHMSNKHMKCDLHSLYIL